MRPKNSSSKQKTHQKKKQKKRASAGDKAILRHTYNIGKILVRITGLLGFPFLQLCIFFLHSNNNMHYYPPSSVLFCYVLFSLASSCLSHTPLDDQRVSPLTNPIPTPSSSSSYSPTPFLHSNDGGRTRLLSPCDAAVMVRRRTTAAMAF